MINKKYFDILKGIPIIFLMNILIFKVIFVKISHLTWHDVFFLSTFCSIILTVRLSFLEVKNLKKMLAYKFLLIVGLIIPLHFIFNTSLEITEYAIACLTLAEACLIGAKWKKANKGKKELNLFQIIKNM